MSNSSHFKTTVSTERVPVDLAVNSKHVSYQREHTFLSSVLYRKTTKSEYVDVLLRNY